MGMGAAVKVALQLYKEGFFNEIKSVIDMGAQEIHLEYEDFEYYCKSVSLDFESNIFSGLFDPLGPRRVPSREFWKLLGIEKIDSLDLDPKYGPFRVDLNFPLADEELKGRYDLVTDFGNNEHPFNVAEAYRTMHRLCGVDGYLWIEQNVYNGNGFFNFDQSFFEGMAAANGYSIAYSAYIVGSGSMKQYFIPASKELLAKLDLNRVDYVGITYIFRKRSDKDFKFYYQGNADKPRELFKVDLLPDRLPAERLYIPIQQADTLKTISFKNLVVELMMRIWGKAKFWA